jgi:hypothetical protein
LPEAVARAFTNDAEVVAIAARALSIIGPPMAPSASVWRCISRRRARGGLAGLSRRPLPGSGSLSAVARCSRPRIGIEGRFAAAALGIAAYGVIATAALRPAVWR